MDRGSEFEGKLTFEGTVRIDGTVKGEIISEAALVVGESGKVEADIAVDSISISGEIKGNIVAKRRVELHPTAVVIGNIKAGALVVEEGAVFQGQCAMDRATPKKSAKTPASGADLKPVGGANA